MHIVALAALATSVDDEAKALATDLGSTVYDERAKLVAGLPAVALLTPDEDRATALAARLRARGHGVIVRAASSIVPARDMISLRRFRLDDDALVATDRPGAILPFADIASLIRATQTRTSESTAMIKEKKFDLTRAVASSGLLTSKTTEKSVTTRVDETEPVLYLFRRSEATPWLLTEHGTDYGGLGARHAATTLPNFLATIERLRALAPGAVYDDRLLARRQLQSPAPRADGMRSTSARDPDLLAHLIAAWPARENARSPITK